MLYTPVPVQRGLATMDKQVPEGKQDLYKTGCISLDSVHALTKVPNSMNVYKPNTLFSVRTSD